VSLPEEPFAKMRPKKAGAPGNQDPFFLCASHVGMPVVNIELGWFVWLRLITYEQAEIRGEYDWSRTK
jgi:hypothetical protein